MASLQPNVKSSASLEAKTVEELRKKAEILYKTLPNVGDIDPDEAEYQPALAANKNFIELYEELAKQTRLTNTEHYRIGVAYENLSAIHFTNNDYAASFASFRESLSAFKQAGDDEMAAMLIGNIKNRFTGMEEYLKEIARLEESLQEKKPSLSS